MKKKKCPQCKNLISLTAPTCLYCGRPNKFVTNNYVKKKWDKEYNKKYKIDFFTILVSKRILFVLIAILIIFLINI